MNDLNELNVSLFERQIVALEHRPRADHIKINHEQNNSPWERFRANPKVLSAKVVKVIETAFDHGGFIAGGAARWLRSQSKVTSLLRGCYVKCGGDIDLFFNDEIGWRDFILKVNELSKEDASNLTLTVSKGKMAVDIEHRPKNTHGFSASPMIQAIRCVVGDPIQILKSFDLVNSMVAFDRHDMWVADRWQEFDTSKILAVAWWGSRNLCYRLSKYSTKYGYMSLQDVSDDMVTQLVSGSNVIDSNKKSKLFDLWKHLMSWTLVNETNLDIKLKVLSCVGTGLEAKDISHILEMNSFIKGAHSGTYEASISNLIDREKDQNLTNEEFNAEEYCWSID